MPKIVARELFDGASFKIDRLGLRPLIDEIEDIVCGFPLHVLNQPQSNGGAVLREMIDARFKKRNWAQNKIGGIDWLKCKQINGTRVCVGCEIQVSGRSELIYRDLSHFRRSIIADGQIDLAVEVTASDSLAKLLTDRLLSHSYALQIIKETRSEDLPIVLIAIEHDGFSEKPLPKKKTNRGKGKAKRRTSSK